MKTTYKSGNGQFLTEFEYSTQKELFKKVAEFQEIFEDNNVHCEGAKILFVTRNIDNNDYYEKKCSKCGKTYKYGQNKSGGTLFPHTSRGWQKWSPADNTTEDDKPQAAGSKGKK